MEYNDFKTSYDLFSALPSEKQMKEYLALVRWGNEPECIHCGNKRKIRKYTSPGIYECPICNVQFSVLQGTIFERSPISLHIWFWRLFEFCLEECPTTKSAERHNIQQRTAWLMDMRIRQTLWEEMDRKLSGKIHCDEKALGADPQKDLRVYYEKKFREKKQLPADHYMSIFGMLEAGKAVKEKPKKNEPAIEGGKLLLFLVDDLSMTSLQPKMIFKTDAANSEFVTDGWSGYSNFNLWCERHYVLNKSKFGKYDFNKHVRKVNKYTLELATEEEILAGKYMILTNNPIENVWRHLQQFYATYFGFSKEFAQLYLNEFMFRWNHLHLNLAERFHILLERCCKTPIYSGVGKERVKL